MVIEIADVERLAPLERSPLKDCLGQPPEPVALERRATPVCGRPIYVVRKKLDCMFSLRPCRGLMFSPCRG